MIPELYTKLDFESVAVDADVSRWKEAGQNLGRANLEIKPRGRPASPPANRRRRLRDLIAKTAAKPQGETSAAVLDNFRLIFACDKEARTLSLRLSRFPVLVDASGQETPRINMLSRTYLDEAGHSYSEPEFSAFVEGYQAIAPLDMQEIWALRAALLRELLDRLTEESPSLWPAIVASLKRISESSWKEFFELVSYAHKILARDPAAAYLRMDYDSRERYREALAELARFSPLTECEIAGAVVDFCEHAVSVSDGSRAAVRRTHVGYYLLDRGRARLETIIEYRPTLVARIPYLIRKHPTVFYLAGIELFTLAIVFSVLYGLGSLTPVYAALVLLVLPATYAAVDFINNLTGFLIPPRALPKLDFSEGIPDDCATMVAVPTLLLNEAQVHDLVLDLEIRFLANRDRNLHFALLTDPPDSDQPQTGADSLVDLCTSLIEGLNLRYKSEGRSPFFLFHRHRAYNQAEGRWMGWERKRGKLLDFNKLLRGAFDAFPVKIGDLSVLPSIRFVITVDCDTQLPRDSAARLIAAIAHPLNQAVVDPRTHMVVEGYGILQPRVGISIQSASRSRLAALYSGQSGFDIYSRAVSDVYQDLFGEGIFTGKGIYEVDTLREVLERRFPENSLLSHDLIEGAYARAGLVSDIDVVDDYPSHFSAYSRRKHRWVRGDWQIMRWILTRVPDYHGRMIPNPIRLISQWKILDNLRRSLLEPGLVILLLSAWLWLPGSAGYWTAATLLLWFIPVLSGLFFGLARIPDNRRELPAWAREIGLTFRDNLAVAVCSLIFLLHHALISSDAIIRTIARVFVTRRKLLEWETSAEAESSERPKSTVDRYLEWTPWIAAALAALVSVVRPDALAAAAPLLTLWIASCAFSRWLDRRPQAGHSRLSKDEVQLLRDSADRIWRFFHDWSSSSTHWLIPDFVSENGHVELKLSPTNLGMMLNARIAGLQLGLTTLSEFIFETHRTLETIVALPKHRGHLFNWYDINTLEPMAPLFVSSVDSGNLVASLWTLKQAALSFARESVVKRGLTKDMAAELKGIAEMCDALVREMDFQFLYQKSKRTLSIGYDVAAGSLHPATYDLLASEARTAYFVAIAKGDIPQESWFRLSRSHTLVRGDRVLLSWTGTMFEYLMPLLWMHHYPDTVIDRSIKVVARAQREYGRRKGIPWGISESAHRDGSASGFGYAAFGVPELAIKRHDANSLVVSPYSSFLAAAIDPPAAVENLRQFQKFGWFGRYGFYEAVDYTRGGGEAVRVWMAHHQGMSLLAIVNLLLDNPIRQYFHSEPQVLATELLLHERPQAAILADADTVLLPELEPMAA